MPQLRARVANVADARSIAVLSTQLGYPATTMEMEKRLGTISGSDRHAVLVAEPEEGHVVGWVEVRVSDAVTEDHTAEVLGLVVDDGCRGAGIGGFLMQLAEAWARERGCRTLRLRSNTARERTHAFYERLGYRVVKTSLTFRKEV